MANLTVPLIVDLVQMGKQHKSALLRNFTDNAPETVTELNKGASLTGARPPVSWCQTTTSAPAHTDSKPKDWRAALLTRKTGGRVQVTTALSAVIIPQKKV